MVRIVLNGYAAYLTHLHDKAPVPPLLLPVEEVAASEGVAPMAVRRSVVPWTS